MIQSNQKKCFPVVIQEVLEKVVFTNAENEHEAICMVKKMHDDGTLVLDSECLTSSEIFVDANLEVE